jgi:hypothetical protein
MSIREEARGKMDIRKNLIEIDAKIQLIKKTAEELSRVGDELPALAKNAARILASIKMLEINVSDLLLLDLKD